MFDEGFGIANIEYFSLRLSRIEMLSEYSLEEKLSIDIMEINKMRIAIKEMGFFTKMGF